MSRLAKTAEAHSEAGAATAEQPRPDGSFSANELLAGGAALGALGATTTVLLGATCPLCVIGAPALLAVGAAKKLRARKRS